MAVSIVSNPYTSDDDNVPQESTSSFLWSSTDGSQTPSSAVQLPEVNKDTQTQEPETENVNLNEDNERLDALHPEENMQAATDIETNVAQHETQIPNMYIKADQDAVPNPVPEDKDIFSTTQEEPTTQENDGFDMDDILWDDEQQDVAETNVVEQPTAIEIPVSDKKEEPKDQIVLDPFVSKQEDTKSKEISVEKKNIQPPLAPRKSLVKNMVTITAWLFGILVLWFIIKTMFPSGIGNQELSVVESTIENVAMDSTGSVDVWSWHASAPEELTVEWLRQQLDEYALQWEEYYQKGLLSKSRDMVRYALYIEKKSKDLVEMLDLDPNMDTKEIVVYFAQFDDYLQTLSNRENDLILNPPVIEKTWFTSIWTESESIWTGSGEQQQPELSELPNG